jgi:hypothetical protein
MTARRRGRRIGAALVAAGLLSAAGAVWQSLPASAEDGGLLSFELKAVSHGFQVIFPAGEGTDVQGAVPEAQAALAAGPIGSGLASIAWPGATPANGGALLQVLQPGCTVSSQTGLPVGSPVCPLPEQASQLNYPVKAESHTGQDPPTSTFDAGPGVSLSSTALANLVQSQAHVQNASSTGFSFGSVAASATSRTDDTKAISEAKSTTQGINIAGALKIDSVVSTATAATDGAKGTGDAVTTVTGVTVGGQPATIDQDGLHLVDQKGQPIGAVANQIAQQALSSSGISVTATAPTKSIEGTKVFMQAGVVVINYKTDSGPFTITLGGAAVTADSGAGLGDLTDLTSDVGGDLSGGSIDPGAVDAGSLGTDLGSTPIDTGVAPSVPGSGAGTGTGEVALGPAENVAAGGKPVKPGAVILGVIAAALLAFGMRRLGDDVLTEQAGTTCPLDGEGS